MIVMDGSIRGRILRCTRGTIDSRSGSEVSPSDFGTGDSLVCIESCDLLRLVEDGTLNSPSAPKGDGRKGVMDTWGETSRDPWLPATPRLSELSPESSESLSNVAFLWSLGVVRLPMKDVISYCVPPELNL